MSQSSSYDVVVIGGGHNGLTAAGYLSKSGFRTIVLEQRNLVGGCVTTEEIPGIPGYRFNLGGADIVSIHGSSIIEDLKLRDFGLEFIRVDPAFFSPFSDGSQIFFWRDLERTVGGIEGLSRDDALSYREFVETWSVVNDLLNISASGPPVSLPDLLSQLPKDVDVDEMVREILMSPARVLDEWFEDDRVKAPLLHRAGAIGVDMRTAGLGMIAGEGVRRVHSSGLARVKGGSGVLTQAMAKAVQYFGGEVRTNAEVSKILVVDGEAKGVSLRNGEKIRAKAVISQIDVKRTFLNLVGSEHFESKLVRRVKKLSTDGGIGFLVHCSLRAVPNFMEKYRVGSEANAATTGICASMEQYYGHWNAIHDNRLPDEPVISINSPSFLDPSLAPSGKHTLYMYVHAPYQLSGGREWEDVKEEFGDMCIDTLTRFAPNVKSSVEARYLESPVDIERRIGNINGSDTHLSMTLDCLNAFRPLPELSRYRTPIKNLYLSGAGTHPGGGISGKPGYNTAQVVIKDLIGNKVE